ncbi:ImmA/IrrE family metallo-endopeptidase [Paenibacillus sp. RC84]|uniref:ImmA/IrrE family metallo-endopeptidase n=1 Tax=Paenibacillus sp. RC84 TaxID=3156252 RepID=UPI0035147803
MLFYYKKTPLEDEVESIYLISGILNPNQLTIEEIAPRLGIWVYFRDMETSIFERDGLYSVVIDKRDDPTMQWKKFLHEVCHKLRHVGNQFLLPPELAKWMDQEANNFSQYAAMPFFMIKEMELPKTEKEIIELLMREFRVTYHMAARRVEQIRLRILQGRLDEEYRKWCLENPTPPLHVERGFIDA